MITLLPVHQGVLIENNSLFKSKSILVNMTTYPKTFLQQEALALRDTISCQLSLIEEKCDVSGMACDLDPADRDALRRRTREILHQCYKFGFEYHKELDREE